MNPTLQFLKKLFTKETQDDKKLTTAIIRIVGGRPFNLTLYRLALKHASASMATPHKQFRVSNERLEYLGDAILGAVIAEFLYLKYPYKDEGFLTEVRARIVNRETLNQLSKKIGLSDLVEFGGSRRNSRAYKSMSGDALEAFIGAIYLDRGFKFTRAFIIKRLIQPHLDIEKIVNTNTNFKSMLIEWAQRNGKQVEFAIINEKGESHNKTFTAQVLINGVPSGQGSGHNKKKAEQAAAEQAYNFSLPNRD